MSGHDHTKIPEVMRGYSKAIQYARTILLMGLDGFTHGNGIKSISEAGYVPYMDYLRPCFVLSRLLQTHEDAWLNWVICTQVGLGIAA